MLTKDNIRDVFLANGFTIKEGQSDLKPYVYAAAHALLAAAQAKPSDEPSDGRWINADDVMRLAREMDVAMNGARGAAPAPQLCDVASQVIAHFSRATHAHVMGRDYLDGVNITDLQKALTWLGVASEDSHEWVAATLADHINRLIAAVLRHKDLFTAQAKPEGAKGVQAADFRAHDFAATVQIPTTEDQAAGMVLVGTAWLRDNAPHRLTATAKSGPAVRYEYQWLNPGDQPDQPEYVFEWREVEPGRNQSIESKCAELLAYRYNGRQVYAVRRLYAEPVTDVPAPSAEGAKSGPAVASEPDSVAFAYLRQTMAEESARMARVFKVPAAPSAEGGSKL